MYLCSSLCRLYFSIFTEVLSNKNTRLKYMLIFKANSLAGRFIMFRRSTPLSNVLSLELETFVEHKVLSIILSRIVYVVPKSRKCNIFPSRNKGQSS